MTDPDRTEVIIQNPGEQPGAVAFAAGAAEASGILDPDPERVREAEALHLAVLEQAGVSDDLRALRDAVDATLRTTASAIAAASGGPGQRGFLGVGIGLPGTARSESAGRAPRKPILTLFTETELPRAALLERLAVSAGTRALTRLPVRQVPVGTITAYSHVAQHRPAPGGVSVGHYAVTAGTLGSRATGLSAPWDSRHLILSNNHVLANSNAASVGDNILQQGAIDGGQNPADRIAVLARWVPIAFGGTPNIVDCAVGWAWSPLVRGEQYRLNNGNPSYYRTGTAPVPATLGMQVGKSGRTTGYTLGQVTQIGVSINVAFSTNTAFFRNQIAIQSNGANLFSKPGDSGSLIWQSNVDHSPVGLLFAGGGGITFANPIADVLAALNIRLLP